MNDDELGAYEERFEAVWEDVTHMSREDLESYAVRATMKVMSLEHRVYAKEQEEREEAHRTALVSPW